LSERNVVVVRDYIEAINRGRLDRLEEWISPDYFEREVDSQGEPRVVFVGGAEAYRERVGALRGAFPDLHGAIDNIMAEGNLVATHITWTGTHKGEFRGIWATGTKVSWGSTRFRRIENGMVIEGWGTTDWWRLLEGLGEPTHRYVR
jgi:predicted ester cyclase